MLGFFAKQFILILRDISSHPYFSTKRVTIISRVTPLKNRDTSYLFFRDLPLGIEDYWGRVTLGRSTQNGVSLFDTSLFSAEFHTRLHINELQKVVAKTAN